jgi:hypothetical protein
MFIWEAIAVEKTERGNPKVSKDGEQTFFRRFQKI